MTALPRIAFALMEHRTSPPVPNDGVCNECEQELPFHLFRCSEYVREEREYSMAEDGYECYVCGFAKPQHHISCFRGADWTSASKNYEGE